ncbi:3-hydroxyacyl-CoA dehydrogenase [Ceratobasidium sp. AG-Ba]|nr:3-hydroxyacyl-CoA dehydrogenase [Ceratobasidium sp. AG-Ba]
MLRRLARLPRVRLLQMPSRSPSAATAVARLAQTAGHLANTNMAEAPTPFARLASTNAGSSSTTMSSTSVDFKEVKNVTCFGAGLMGAGIAQVAAQNGFKVTLCDVTPQALENGLKIIRTSLGRVAKKAHPESPEQQKSVVDGVMSTISTTTDAEVAVKQADLVVEAIVENLDVKRKLFASLDSYAPKDCIFATNTSSLSVSEIAESTSPTRRAAFGGLHFFNRKPQMKLVEVIRTSDTSESTTAALLDVCKKMKKTSVNCKDTPGLILPPSLVPYMLEAVRMLERGDATAEDIDTAMKLGAALAMGPIQLTDFVGLDTCQHIMDGWREKGALSPEMVQPIKALEDKVKEGKLGRKSGEGFFKY